MSDNKQTGRVAPEEKTIQAAGRIVKYSREIYHLESVEEVANMTIEATPHFIEGYPTPTVVEIRAGTLRVLESIQPGVSCEDEPGAVVRQAYETGREVVCAGAGTEVAYEGEEIDIVDASADTDHPDGVTIAAPAVYTDGKGDSGAVLAVHWPSLPRVEQYHVKPVAYLAEHVATALVNIRSRERLERAQTDLAKRKEMVEVYDRLLRHDLGNDLQIISGFSEIVEPMLEDDSQREYVQKIHATAESAGDLIETVGDTVKTLKQGGEPEVTAIEPVLRDVVETVLTKHDSLTVHYEPDEFAFQAYAGDLIDSVFTNVLSNAAVHNEGPVAVHLYSETPTPETVVIGMADDGTGVPVEIRDRLFQMGQKGPESDGTGFGLGLTRTLVESYGGTVDVRDSEYGGADFRITLQRA